jgi:hypothetical protein
MSSMVKPKREAQDAPSKIWQACMARRTGACDLPNSGCFQCGPVEQALRTAGWLECQWPRFPFRQRDSL